MEPNITQTIPATISESRKNSILFIILVPILFSLIGGTSVYFWHERKESTNDVVVLKDLPINEKPDFITFVKQGGTYRCLLSAKIRQNELTPVLAYIHEELVSGEYSFDNSDTHFFVAQNDITYVWDNRDIGDMGDYGMIYTNNMPSSTGTPELARSIILYQVSDYVCEPWIFDSNKFNVPTSTMRFLEDKEVSTGGM